MASKTANKSDWIPVAFESHPWETARPTTHLLEPHVEVTGRPVTTCDILCNCSNRRVMVAVVIFVVMALIVTFLRNINDVTESRSSQDLPVNGTAADHLN